MKPRVSYAESSENFPEPSTTIVKVDSAIEDFEILLHSTADVKFYIVLPSGSPIIFLIGRAPRKLYSLVEHRHTAFFYIKFSLD
jgi:hypothetical protein